MHSYDRRMARSIEQKVLVLKTVWNVSHSKRWIPKMKKHPLIAASTKNMVQILIEKEFKEISLVANAKCNRAKSDHSK